jgi:hypothetical protein
MDIVTVLDNLNGANRYVYQNATVIDSPYSFAVVSVEGEIMIEVARYSFNRFSYFIKQDRSEAYG